MSRIYSRPSLRFIVSSGHRLNCEVAGLRGVETYRFARSPIEMTHNATLPPPTPRAPFQSPVSLQIDSMSLCTQQNTEAIALQKDKPDRLSYLSHDTITSSEDSTPGSEDLELEWKTPGEVSMPDLVVANALLISYAGMSCPHQEGSLFVEEDPRRLIKVEHALCLVPCTLILLWLIVGFLGSFIENHRDFDHPIWQQSRARR